MGHTLTLALPEQVYQYLRQQAEQTGQLPETVVIAWLTTAIQSYVADPWSSLLAPSVAMASTGPITMVHTWGRLSGTPWTAWLLKVRVMPGIFADTAGWGHLVDPSQA